MSVENGIVAVGEKFTKLTVIRQHEIKGKLVKQWVCKCSCGNEKEVIEQECRLRAGDRTSCGCRKLEHAKTLTAKTKSNVRHGDSKSIEYRTWTNINQRCHNPNSKDYYAYGAIGTTVYLPWRTSYELFLSYVLENIGRRPTPKHSLDRFPNKEGNYEPGNVRWATKKEQSRNRTDNRYLLYKGEQRLSVELAEIAREQGNVKLTSDRLYERVAVLKWDIDKAMTTPPRKGNY